MEHEDHQHHQPTAQSEEHHSCHSESGSKKKRDWILLISSTLIVLSYLSFYLIPETIETYQLINIFAESVFQLVSKMWWGVLLGIFSVGLLGTVPRKLVVSILGKGGTLSGILRATGAGVMLDLCSHGILLVGTKLYERGASLGQMMAFLIASPWNSLSLTLILWSLVGFKWMISILLLSLLIAIISGLIFEKLVKAKILPENPNKPELPENYSFSLGLKNHLRSVHPTPKAFIKVGLSGIRDSKMILRWIFFGIVLAALIRTFMNPEVFAQLFGPTLGGLGVTLLFATILEVCSEGSMPVATDMLLRAKAAGNTFAFLMTGVSTDYTEIMAIKETTGRWKTAFFLPIVTLPQVVLIALVLNQMAV
ncbi:permease [Patescibacteria group bacterium]|nr:permease [Patescibacteria group bacterium]MBU1123912.1 permease [Patescibacteria group bacterium]MBU1910871.1 permease [Patescibacteria group bacterium]